MQQLSEMLWGNRRQEISSPSLLQVPSTAQVLVEASLQGSLGYAVRASQDLCQGRKEQRSSIRVGMKISSGTSISQGS